MKSKFILLIYFIIGATKGLSQTPNFNDISDLAGTGNGPFNRGILIGDYNNDGYEDIFVVANDGNCRLFKNLTDGIFEDVTDMAGIHPIGLSMTGAWIDIDNDGDLDLFIGNYYTSASPVGNYFYLNNGDGTFSDISVSSGLNSNSQTRSVHILDIDLDGYLDIYVCNLLEQNIYWRNNGNNTFTNYTFFSGLSDTGISMGAVFFDYDNDGDQDIYLTHDGNQANIMYENNGFGAFTNVSSVTNLNVAGQGMGVDHGDINNDGHLDIYVTNLGANFLLLNNGNGTYTEIAELAGVTDGGGMGWGCFFLDYDNDGWEDLYVINDSSFSPATNKLYKNNSNNTFTLVSENNPLQSFYAGKGGHWADLNNDGYPEIIVANREDEIGVQIFENNNSGNNWIGLELEGTSDSKDACGTRVQVNTINGTKLDEVTCGSSYAAMGSPRIYFGLGQGEVSNILITWPNGAVDFIESMPINEIHFIQQGSSGVDMDQDGFILEADCDDTNSSVNPDAIEIIYNGIDDDCNPLTLDDDLDEDGFNLADDCDDNNTTVNPDAIEIIYNGIDDDCNPLTLDDDLDQDGYNAADDCDDNNAAINSGAIEIENNGIDEDCDGIDLIVSIDELAKSMFKIFPNPTKHVLFLEHNQVNDFHFIIFDKQGKEISGSNIHVFNSTTIEIQLAALSRGVYFLQIRSASGVEYIKFVKM